MAVIIMTILIFVFMFLSVPIAFALGLAALVFVILSGLPLELVVQRMVYGMDNFILMAIPFFMLAGQLMNTGGITARIFKFANSLVGHIRGGLGHVNIVASIIFAGMSGSAQADVAGLGAIEIKAMEDEGYDTEFASAVTAASSTIGPIIPPSIGMVIYGAIAGVSVGGLFLGGVIPGFLMGLSLMVLVYIIAGKKNYKKTERKAPLRIMLKTFVEAFLPLMTPIIIVGGIVFGVVTPTEASVTAVIYAAILGMVVYKEIKPRMLPEIFMKTVIVTTIAMFVISTASLTGWIFAREQVPAQLTTILSSLTTNKYVLLILINVLLLILGCLMEGAAIIVMITPVLINIVTLFGIDPVHFGVLLVLNVTIGMITPPLGMVLFVLQSITGLSYGKLVKNIIPFYIPLILVLFIITFYEPIVMFLPRLFMKQ